MKDTDLDEPDEHAGSAFVHLDGEPHGRGAVATLVEVDSAGFVSREIGVADDGRPVYLTRPGERGLWNEAVGHGVPQARPGSVEFDDFWLGLGTAITAADFEFVYGQADENLPHTVFGGTPVMTSRVVGCVLFAIVVLGVLLVALLLVWLASTGVSWFVRAVGLS